MKNLRVSAKLIVSFLTMAALAALVGVVGIYGLARLETKDTQLYDSNLVAISAMANFRETYQNERAQLRTMILAVGDPSEVQKSVNEFSAMEADIKEAMRVYESTIEDEAEEADYLTAKRVYLGDYDKAKKGMIEAALAGDHDLAHQRLIDAGPVVAPIVSGLQASASKNDAWAAEAVADNSSLAALLFFVQIAVLIVAVAVALFFAFYISGLISKPLGLLTAFMRKAGATGDITLSATDEQHIARCAVIKDEVGECIKSTASFIQHMIDVSNVLEKIADGDLTAEIEALSNKDTIGVSMNKMTDNLNRMFSEISNASAQVSTAAKQISDGAQGLAQGATEQAASTQQLSSSIAQVSTQTKENSDMADKASTLAHTIRSNAQKGSEQMQRMTAAVKEINEASQSIGKIIKVIDDIAFQTNILALNAAVEAARAGQHGKGFAVVAEEVRNLAAKSADAAKSTSAIIETSVQKAEMGVRIADETAASLAEIVEGINESNRIVDDIAKSSEAQTASISQINTGVEQVSQVVQTNSATAEQSAAASQQMRGQSDMLLNLVSKFRFKDMNVGGNYSTPTNKMIVIPEKTQYTASGDFGKY